jgi:hypothetical protein
VATVDGLGRGVGVADGEGVGDITVPMAVGDVAPGPPVGGLAAAGDPGGTSHAVISIATSNRDARGLGIGMASSQAARRSPAARRCGGTQPQ